MHGYVTFVLAVAILLIFLHLLSTQGERITLTKPLAVERSYQTQQNTKELILESARQGAYEGLLLYLAEEQIDPSTFNKEKAEEYARLGAYLRLVELRQHELSEDIDIEIWCGKINSIQLNQEIEKMKGSKQTERCEHCLPIEACLEFVQVEVDSGPTEIQMEVWLEGQSTFMEEAVIGLAMHSKEYGIGSVAYIPTDEKQVIRIDAWPDNH